MSLVIDAHVHLWDPARGDYGWLTPALPDLYRRIDKDELHAHIGAAGVDGVVLVQAAPTAAESEHLLSIAEQTPWIFGVVGWLDFDALDVEAALAERAAHRKFVGVRPMLQDISDVDWILDPRRGRVLSALASHDLVFDALIKPVHMPRIQQIAREVPNLRIVIDHAAKPAIAGAVDDGWLDAMKGLAACPNVVCKLSGLLTELAPGAHPDSVLNFVRAVLETFGPGRVIWGSDWPVLTEAATYEQWHDLTRRALSGLSESEREAVMGGNAGRVYRLKPTSVTPAILLHPNDNVLVCCRPVLAGERFRINGSEEIQVRQATELGHKLARRPLSSGEKVIKYGAPIGSMTNPATTGEWVHLHNMRSDYISVHALSAQASKP